MVIPGDLRMELLSQGTWSVHLIWLVLFGLLKEEHLGPFRTFEEKVTVKGKVKVEHLGEEERMLVQNAAEREGEKENLCSLCEYFLILLSSLV